MKKTFLLKATLATLMLTTISCFSLAICLNSNKITTSTRFSLNQDNISLNDDLYDNLEKVNKYEMRLKSSNAYRGTTYSTNYVIKNEQLNIVEPVIGDWKPHVYGWQELSDTYIDNETNNEILYKINENLFHYQSDVTMVGTGIYNPGTPVYRTQPLWVDIKNRRFHINKKWNTNVKSEREFKNVNSEIRIKLNNPFKSCFLDINNNTEFNINKLLMVSDEKTFRGFRSNNFGLEVNNDYLKAIIFSSVCKMLAKKYFDNATENQKQDPNFIKIMTFLSEGKIIDKSCSLISDLYLNDYESSNHTLMWYLNMYYDNDLSFFNELENETNYLYEYCLDNDINIEDEFLAYKLINLFRSDNQNNNFEIHYEIENQAFVKQFKIVWDNQKKKFIVQENKTNNELSINVEEEANEYKAITINKILFNSKYLKNIEINIINDNNEISLFKEPYVSNPQFNFKDLFKFKDYLNKNHLEILNNNSILEQQLNNPSKFIDSEVFLNNLFSFNSNNLITSSSLLIKDYELYKYLSTSNTNLYNNNFRKNIIRDIKLIPYDSVSGFEIVVEYMDVSRDGNINKNKIINQTYKVVTDRNYSKVFNNYITNEKIKLSEGTISMIDKDYIINNLICYQSNTNANYLIKTDLLKHDWVINCLKDIEIIKTNKTLNINFKLRKVSDQKYWLGQVDGNNDNEITKTFRIDFDKLNSSLVSNNTSATNNKNFYYIFIPTIIVVILMITIISALIIKYRYHKNIQKK